MYQGALPPVSNCAGLDLVYEVIDDDTGEAVDLSAATIAFEVRDSNSGTPVLSATTENGKVSIINTGVFRISFAAAEMQALCADTYDVGCTIANGISEPQQFLIATLPVLDGIVRGG